MFLPTLYASTPSFLAAMGIGGLAKLAARIVLRTNLEWPQAWAYGGIAFGVYSAAALIYRSSGFLVPLPVVVLAALLLQFALGGWYFASKLTTEAGRPLTFQGSILISVVTYGLAIVLLVLLAGILPLLPLAKSS